MTNATETFRAMLDEREVEWWETTTFIGATITDEGIERHYLFSTWWNSPVFGRVEATDMGDGVLHMARLNGCNLTPEQAIAATLGPVTLSASQVSNAVYAHSIHADCADSDWQAIASSAYGVESDYDNAFAVAEFALEDMMQEVDA